ncbi:hypothetical protein TURU_119222 [Turdus rufiventris]|nr:hypothetical protein TURU_119222 [Turdus rufiventris]
MCEERMETKMRKSRCLTVTLWTMMVPMSLQMPSPGKFAQVLLIRYGRFDISKLSDVIDIPKGQEAIHRDLD